MAEPNTDPSAVKIRRRKHTPATLAAVCLLLAAPIVGMLWVGTYNSASPRLWGFPFFYWYQLLWVVISAVTTASAYLLMTRTGHQVEIEESPADKEAGR